MRYVLFLLGALAAGLAVATMVPTDLSPQIRLGISGFAGILGPGLVVLWAWIELKARPRLRAVAPWFAGMLVQGVAVGVPMLYGKTPDDAFALLKKTVKENVETTTVAAMPPVTDQPVDWQPKWVAAIEGPGLEVVSDVHVDRPHQRVLVAGASRQPSTVWLSARAIDDGRELWTRRMPADESGSATIERVDADGTIWLNVGLVGVLTLPDGREIGKRVRHVSAWRLAVTPDAVRAVERKRARFVVLPNGDAVTSVPGAVQRVAEDGTVRWSHTIKRSMAYEFALLGSRLYLYGEPGGAGGKIPKHGEHLIIEIESGELIDRAPWFDAPGGKITATMASAPGTDIFMRVALPLHPDPPARRPDGTVVERTGDSEFLVERVDEQFRPRWSRRFSNGKFERRLGRITMPAGPFVLPSGALVVGGSFKTPVDLGDGPLTPIGGSDLYLVELDPNDGTIRAMQQIGGSGKERMDRAAFDGEQLVIAGGFTDGLSIGTEQIVAPAREGDRFARDEAFVALLAPASAPTIAETDRPH